MSTRLSMGRRAMIASLVLALSLQAVSCGVLIHPDRVGQPHRGRLDTSIVLLDALGLLFFFVPGVIAFIVDFATGAIYLPASECAQREGDERDGEFIVIRMDKNGMTREAIEAAVADRLGRPVELKPGEYEAHQLDRLDEFRTRTEAIARRDAYAGSEVLFRAQSH